MSCSRIPVVDLGQLSLHHPAEPTDLEWQRVGKEITDAFKNIGFVYLKEHGIPEDKIERLVNASGKFFNLPEEVKTKYPRTSDTRQGYNAINKERFQDEIELRESYDFRTADGPFPDAVTPDFRPAAAEIMESFLKLGKNILVALALGLGLKRNFFLDLHSGLFSDRNTSVMRVLHYPPVPAHTQPNTTRCATHSDYSTITLLVQDEMGGLFVQNRNGEWINADPIPGTILLNIGEVLQIITNDNLISTEHKVLIPAEEIRRRMCRRSTAFFIQPDDSALIAPLDGSSEPIKAIDFIESKFRETYLD